jgi:hypothetical protein
MISDDKKPIEYLIGLKPNAAKEWLALYLQYGSSAPFPSRLGDRKRKEVLPEIIDAMEELGIDFKAINRFKRYIVTTIQRLLNEIDGSEDPNYVADLVDCIYVVPLAEGLPYLINFARAKEDYLKQTSFGKFDLYTHLLQIIFSFASNNITDKYHSKIVKLARRNISFNNCTHLCFNYLISTDESTGWEYVPDLIRAYLGNPEIDLKQVIYQFLEKATVDTLKAEFPILSMSLFQMAIEPELNINGITPWGLFSYLASCHGKFLFVEYFLMEENYQSEPIYDIKYDPQDRNYIIYCAVPESESPGPKNLGNKTLIWLHPLTNRVNNLNGIFGIPGNIPTSMYSEPAIKKDQKPAPSRTSDLIGILKRKKREVNI